MTAEGTVTAGNASGINDGAAAVLIASEQAVEQYQLKPRAKIIASTAVGVEPRIMGFAPAPAIKKLLKQANLTLEQMDVIELNEAFAAQALAVTRDLGLADDTTQVNPKWWCNCDWSSTGCIGCTFSHHGFKPIRTNGWNLCLVFDVYWCRSRHCNDYSAGLTLLMI